jgi:hypothetical protein
LCIADLEFHGRISRCCSISRGIYHAFADIDADHTPTTSYQSGEIESVVAEPATDIEHRFSSISCRLQE